MVDGLSFLMFSPTGPQAPSFRNDVKSLADLPNGPQVSLVPGENLDAVHHVPLDGQLFIAAGHAPAVPGGLGEHPDGEQGRTQKLHPVF